MNGDSSYYILGCILDKKELHLSHKLNIEVMFKKLQLTYPILQTLSAKLTQSHYVKKRIACKIISDIEVDIVVSFI